MLIGQYYHNIDPKGRMIFPSKLRSDMGEHFYVTLWFNSCLVAFSEEAFGEICAKIKQQSIAKVSNFERILFSSACEVETDKQGRILIPSQLREDAGIDKDVVVIGVMDRVEIWDKQRWENMRASMDNAAFDQSITELNI